MYSGLLPRLILHFITFHQWLSKFRSVKGQHLLSKVCAMAENAANVYEINRQMDITLIADFYEEIEELL